MSQESNQHRLDTLRHQWRSEPTPRRTLQLAEEYGRTGDYDQAMEVLRSGLEKHPGHVASRVALGRYLLESGRPAEARKALEQIALEDQTHLVANKLLVESHLELGEAREARNRLDLYTLLNESDAEIESFEERLLALQGASGPASEAVESPTEDPEPAAQGALEPSGEVEIDGGFLASLSETPAVRIGYRGGAGGLSREAESPGPVVPETVEEIAPEPGLEATQEPVAEAASAPPSEGDLFQDVWAGIERKSYWDSLGSDGIFALEPRTREREAIEPESAPVVQAEEQEAPPVVAAEPETVPAGVSESEGEVVESTVTLGRLYLEQGHRQEAGRVFQEVLAREPGNRSALAGLAAVESKNEWTLNAADLIPAEFLRGASGVERRRELLTAYLARVKREPARV